jgi:8-oxo-dGTP pyrophosphatase MutT (NUDIX family)
MCDRAKEDNWVLGGKRRPRPSCRLDPARGIGRIIVRMEDDRRAALGARVSAGWRHAIRPIAAAVIRNGDHILVWDDHNPETGEVVRVPLAGGIEFGETGAEAIARELSEEIGATTTRVDFLGVLEDIFEWNGQKRHELYLIYDVDLADRHVYTSEEVVVDEGQGDVYRARWRPLSAFSDSARLVPDGLLDMILGGGRPGGAEASA